MLVIGKPTGPKLAKSDNRLHKQKFRECRNRISFPQIIGTLKLGW